MALSSLARRLGVTRIARISGLDRSGIEAASAIRPLGHVLQVTSGKGITFAEAARSALGEAAELWAAERVLAAELRYGAPGDLRASLKSGQVWEGSLGSAGHCVAPELWGETVFAGFREGRHLFHDTRVLVPAAALHCPPPGAPPIGPLAWQWTSNGMGAHPRRETAIRHALLEAVERDQLARTLPDGWTEKILMQRALATTHLPSAAAAWQRRLAVVGLDLFLFDLTPERGIGLPVAGALLLDRERGPIPLAAGYACRLDAADVLLAALLEAGQSQLTDIHGARDDVEPMASNDVERLARALSQLRPRRSAANLPRPPKTAGVQWLLRQLWRHGHREAAVFDLAPADLGLHVVKVVVPSLRISGLL